MSLITQVPQQLSSYRKELIKSGWNHLKRDDSACRFYAFLNVCHFLSVFVAPEKITLQVRSALWAAAQATSAESTLKESAGRSC